MAAVTFASPARTLLKPMMLEARRRRWIDGRRKSASISSARLPCCAREIAMFTLVTVLPAFGRALVTKIVIGGAAELDSKLEVRSARYDSANADCGSFITAVAVTESAS